MDCKKANSIQGFTLIEVIVAMTIMSFMMLGMYSITDNSFKQKEAIQAEDRDYLQVHTAMNRMQSDIDQIYSPLYYRGFTIKKNNKNAVGSYAQGNKTKYSPTPEFPKTASNGHAAPQIFNEEKNELVFFTTANRRKIQDQHESRYLWVRYSLMQEEADPDNNPDIPVGEFVLVRQIKAFGPFIGETDWDKIKPQVLLRGIKSLNFQFWNSKKKDWADRLRELNEIEKFAPKGIRLNIEWIDVGGVEKKITKVFRPSWPPFDVEADEREREALVNSNGSNPPPNGGASR